MQPEVGRIVERAQNGGLSDGISSYGKGANSRNGI